MFCTITGELCTRPVISKKTGHIFEEHLIQKHLKTTGKCPVTEDPLSMDDLIAVQGYHAPTQPKVQSMSSIPGLLKAFQNQVRENGTSFFLSRIHATLNKKQWDQVMLESYSLKKHVEDVRQQLSHALYQYDAACRVIARLTQERDRALQELSDTRQNMTHSLSIAQQRQPVSKVASESKQDGDGDTEMTEANANGQPSPKQKMDIMGGDTPQFVKEATSMTDEFVQHISKTAQVKSAIMRVSFSFLFPFVYFCFQIAATWARKKEKEKEREIRWGIASGKQGSSGELFGEGKPSFA